MRFLSEQWLWTLLAVAALTTLYLVFSLRRGVHAARLASASLLASVLPHRPRWWRRHLPAALMLLSLAISAVALARPAHSVRVPRERATVMLAIDVSNSMEATDVRPNRLTAAARSALAFLGKAPPTINIGLVSFSATAAIVVPPTTDRDALRTGIGALRVGPATAIGEGILACLQAIDTLDTRLRLGGSPVPPQAAIVLLSDGYTTSGRPNSVATAAARSAGVPVHTIAFGTPAGVLDLSGTAVSVPTDADALRAIARDTAGTFHEAASGDELTAVYGDLGSSLGYVRAYREVTSACVGLSLLLGLAAGTSAVVLGNRLP